MSGRHRDNKRAETDRKLTRVEKPKRKEWPKGKRQTPSDTDGPQVFTDRVRKTWN